MTMFSFDYFNQFEIPNISLANPDGTLLYSLGTIFDRKLNLRFNALSTFSFTAPAIVNGSRVDYYDSIDYRRLVNIENIGVFMVTQMELDNDGISEIKKITCQSRECELSFKKMSLFKGTYKFYDFKTPENTLMGKVLDVLPGWSLGTPPSLNALDIELVSDNLERTFDVLDITIYDFLMNQVSPAYQCIFTFDTLNRVIIAHTIEKATHRTDIFLSYDNLIENTNIKEITEELATALSVYGGGTLEISFVNPIGTNTIYNFNYYDSDTWMSPGLRSKLHVWKNNVDGSQTTYANLFTDWIQRDNNRITQQSILDKLSGELTVLETLQKVQIQQGGIDLTLVNGQINAKKKDIADQQKIVAIYQQQEDAVYASMTAIHNSLDMQNAFGSDFNELNTFIIGSTYTNPYLLKLDGDSASSVQIEAQHLYNQAYGYSASGIYYPGVLDKVSQPRYTFDVNSANFVFLKDFQTFIDQLVLGAVVTIEFNDGKFTKPALLGMDLDYDDPTQFKLIFSNRLRLDDAAFQFSDLFTQSLSAGITTTFNSQAWSSWSNNSKDQVTQFINSALDTAKNMVTSGSNQEFIMDVNGLRGRYLDPVTKEFSPEQLWMLNNIIAFTDDNWDHARAALGKVILPGGTVTGSSQSGSTITGSYITSASAYGLIADVIVGRLLASNDLWIENASNSFHVDGDGARLYNATFTIESENNSRILLDPNDGISISKKIGESTYEKNFYIDLNGNIIFSGSLMGASGTFTGKITATSGKIGMWNIDEFGLFDDSGDNYIYGNGKIRLGALEINGSEAWFHGKIYAENIAEDSYVQGRQIKNIIADTITAGTLSGIDIFGKNIYWPGVHMFSPALGYSTIQATNDISMTTDDGFIGLNRNGANIYHRNGTHIGLLNSSGATYIDGDLRTTDNSFAQGKGWSTTIPFGAATAASLGSPVFSGAGLNDASFSGTFEGIAQVTFKLMISGNGTPDTFDVYSNNILLRSGVAITGVTQSVALGVSVAFGSTTGHTINNSWSIIAIPAGSAQKLTFVNGILVDPFYNQTTGSSGSGTSGSGGSVVPPPVSGSVSFQKAIAHSVFFNDPVLAYEGGGVISTGTCSYDPIHTLEFAFRMDYDGPALPRGRFHADITNTSGSCYYVSDKYWLGANGATDGWTNTKTYDGITLYQWSSMGALHVPTMGTMITLDGPFTNSSNLPPSSPPEDRWFVVYITVNEVYATTKWKINKVYLSPDDLSPDIVLWQN